MSVIVDQRVSWRRRTGDTAGGLSFLMFEGDGPNIRAELSAGAEKSLLDGRVSLTLTRGSYRYGDELQVQIWSKEPARVLTRRSEAWNRSVIYVPTSLGTARVLEALAQEIRQRSEEAALPPLSVGGS